MNIHEQYHLILGHHDHQQYNIIVDQKLDTTDKVQLEVKYRLPPVGPSPRARTKVIQVVITITIIISTDFKITMILDDQVTLEKDNGTFGVVVRGGSHDVPLRCRPFTVVQVKMLMTQCSCICRCCFKRCWCWKSGFGAGGDIVDVLKANIMIAVEIIIRNHY